MNDFFTVEKKQTSLKNEYRVACSTAKNGSKLECVVSPDQTVPDMLVKEERCCGDTWFVCTDESRVCALPDGDECDIGKDSGGDDPLINYGWSGRAPNLKCVYDKSSIDRIEQVEKFFTKFDRNRRNEYEIMSALCSRPDEKSDCVRGLKTCSVIQSVNKNSNACREWYANLDENERNGFVKNYCDRFNTDDCKCVNRSSNKDYINMKHANPINDYCWYAPCANSGVTGSYFPTSESKNIKCPENVCSIVINALKNRDVYLSHNDLICKLNADKSDGNGKKSETDYDNGYYDAFKSRVGASPLLLAAGGLAAACAVLAGITNR